MEQAALSAAPDSAPGTRREWPFWSALVFITLLALFLRSADLDVRPLHNDEGVNFYFAKTVLDQGYYAYSHENYHGPSYFYLLAGFIGMFGESELVLRAVTVFFGAFLPWLLVPLRRREGSGFVLFAALLSALSPPLVFYSRYAIHEVLLVFFSAWFAVSLYRWWRGENGCGLFAQASAAFALMVATKETWVITCAALGAGALAIGKWRESVRRLREDRRKFYLATMLISLLVIGVFTGGFQSFASFRELFLSFPQWFSRSSSDVGHAKPFWYYYLVLLTPTEPYVAHFVPWVLGALAVLAFRKRSLEWILRDEAAFGRFTFVWLILTFLVYSFIPYKTPWLVINVTAPGILFIAWAITRPIEDGSAAKALLGYAVASLALVCCVSWYLAKAFGFEARIALGGAALAGGSWAVLGAVRGARFLRGVTAVLLPLLALAITLYYNFREIRVGGKAYPIIGARPYGSGNPFSYVHTADGMLRLVEDIEAYRKTHPDARILIGVEQYWPLPYYFRESASKVAYARTKGFPKDPISYEVLILDKNVKEERPGWIAKYYRLSDVQETQVYYSAQ